jgi:hypothetical protein
MLRTALILAFLVISGPASSHAQTGSTGAIAGTVRDQTGAVVPAAQVTARNLATNETRQVVTQENGTFVFPLLAPGEFVLEVTMGGFTSARREGIRVAVTETTSLSIELQVEGVTDAVQVTAATEILQSKSNTLGQVVDSRAMESLPLVTRNYTQIIGLSPGVTTDVTDAGALGRGTGGTSPPNAHGNRSYDNNFQMNGLGVNDIFSQGTISGGVPVPNPDTIMEFKVQTGQYDAAFGRNAGANVNLVTKGGTNQLRGSVFEFFRDRSLNANSFFSERNGQPKPILDQNQYGFTVGGPVVRDRLLFFGSYQGTRQTNGVSSLVTVLAPPLTDDRSAAAIGRLFAGQRGAQQNAMGGVGPAILADGSNINPVALRLLQLRNADGTYLIPTPQRVNPAAAFAVQGSSTFSTPSAFDENQYMVNLDYVHTSASRFSGRFFTAGGTTEQAFPVGNTPGFPLGTDDRYVAASVAHSWVLSSRLLNEARFGFGFLGTDRSQNGAFRFSDVGIQAAPQNDDLPTITITGSYNLASSAIGTRSQRTFLFEDSLSWVSGRHNVQVGGGFTRALRDFENFRQPGQLQFQTFPDFLLGLNAAQNGTNLFSNVFVSVDLTGQFDRASRNWEASAYVQDSFQLSSAAHRRDRSAHDRRSRGAQSRPPRRRLARGHRGSRELSGHGAGRRDPDRQRHHHGRGEDTHPGAARRLHLATSWRQQPRRDARRLRPVLLANDRASADTDHHHAAIRSASRVGWAAERGRHVCESVSQPDSDRRLISTVRAVHAGVESDRDGGQARSPARTRAAV